MSYLHLHVLLLPYIYTYTPIHTYTDLKPDNIGFTSTGTLKLLGKRKCIDMYAV